MHGSERKLQMSLVKQAGILFKDTHSKRIGNFILESGKKNICTCACICVLDLLFKHSVQL